MSINFELVSPEEKLVSEPVEMAVIPGVEGEMGVGAGHASFVVALKAGVVQLFAKKEDKAPRKIFIAGGFADVTGENCTVLAEEAVNVNDISEEETHKELKALQSDLEIAQEPVDKKRLTEKIILAKARLSAVTGKLID